MNPTLDPSVPLLRRGPGEVQLGLDPGRTVVVRGLSEAEILALEHLDGSRSPASAAQAAKSARLEAVVRDLLNRGLLRESPRRRPRPPAAVVVGGEDTTTGLLADLLRESGLRVHAGRGAMDDLDLAHRSGGSDRPVTDVALVVPVAVGALSPHDHPARLPTTCLPVVLRPHSVVVGPFVDRAGPCLHCVDLTRADHDPSWAMVLAQVGRLNHPRTKTPLAALAASLACSRILTWLELTPPCRGHDPGTRATPGNASVEMCLDPPRTLIRSWSRHPRCPRHG